MHGESKQKASFIRCHNCANPPSIEKAHASRPYSWINERGPKVELHINGTLIASAPKEKADMVRSSLGKLEKAFSEQRKHYYYKITKHENETFAISLKDGEEILRITPDLAKYHKCSSRLLAGLWLTNFYEAHYGSKTKWKDQIT